MAFLLKLQTKNTQIREKVNMLKYANVLIVLMLTLICQFVFSTALIAGDNIPSEKELAFAQQLYKLMVNFDANEKKFLESSTKLKNQDQLGIKNAFKSKFNYTKDYYLKVKALVSTSKFLNTHKKLLEGIYGNLQYLQKVVVELDKGKNLPSINAEYGSVFKNSNVAYESGINEFMTIIKSWQRPYYQKVVPPVENNK